MLRKSLEELDEKTIATAFGISSIGHRLNQSLIKQLHPSLAKAFKTGKISKNVARELRYVKPERQLEILELMESCNDFSVPFDPEDPDGLDPLEPDELEPLDAPELPLEPELPEDPLDPELPEEPELPDEPEGLEPEPLEPDEPLPLDPDPDDPELPKLPDDPLEPEEPDEPLEPDDPEDPLTAVDDSEHVFARKLKAI